MTSYRVKGEEYGSGYRERLELESCEPSTKGVYEMPSIKDDVCLIPMVSDGDGRCMLTSMDVPSLVSASPADT
jgi:hypothetical protein